jgi:hypothetical protein
MKDTETNSLCSAKSSSRLFERSIIASILLGLAGRAGS